MEVCNKLEDGSWQASHVHLLKSVHHKPDRVKIELYGHPLNCHHHYVDQNLFLTPEINLHWLVLFSIALLFLQRSWVDFFDFSKKAFFPCELALVHSCDLLKTTLGLIKPLHLNQPTGWLGQKPDIVSRDQLQNIANCHKVKPVRADLPKIKGWSHKNTTLSRQSKSWHIRMSTHGYEFKKPHVPYI